MNCTITYENGQVGNEEFCETIQIPSTLVGFKTDCEMHLPSDVNGIAFLHGHIAGDAPTCPKCGCRMNVNGRRQATIHHIPLGTMWINVKVKIHHYRCPNCGVTKMQHIRFRHPRHRITHQLHAHIIRMLGDGLPIVKIAEITGIGRNVIKEIDKDRLKRLYTDNGNLRRPDHYARALAIDEFKLHNGHRYATHIIDLDTGEVLWISEGKSKDVVTKFIAFVGDDWMMQVQAVSCDMNAGFCNAFTEAYPHLTIVFDHFHVIKNFNEKVVSMIRKDEQNRLESEGAHEQAVQLKKSRYILTSSRENILNNTSHKTIQRRSSGIFDLKDKPSDEVIAKKVEENRKHYLELIASNALLGTVDRIKEHLEYSYDAYTQANMSSHINSIIDTCNGSDNPHLEWFARFLKSHFDGIVSHAECRISSGKMEGINNKIKTLRRQSYGFADTEYFFLKIIDSSHKRERDKVHWH